MLVEVVFFIVVHFFDWWTGDLWGCQRKGGVWVLRNNKRATKNQINDKTTP